MMNGRCIAGWRAMRHLHTVCAALLAVLGLTISCNRDCPTQPPPPEDKGYNFYVSMREAGPTYRDAKVYVYNSKVAQLVDSVPLGDCTQDYVYDDIEVSPDEKYLILSTTVLAPYPHNLMIIDLATKLPVLTHLGSRVDAEISPDGKFVAMQGDTTIWFMDGSTFDTVSFDTAIGYGGAWDSTGSTFYCLTVKNGSYYIRRFVPATLTWLPEILVQVPGYILRLQTTANPAKVFLFSYTTYSNSRVVSYSIADSSIGFTYSLASFSTRFAIAADWKTVLFTDPIGFDDLGKKNIYLVNETTDALETIIPCPPYGAVMLNPTEITVTPDNKFAMVASSQLFQSIGLLSITDRKYVAFFKPDTSNIGQPIAVECRTRSY